MADGLVATDPRVDGERLLAQSFRASPWATWTVATSLVAVFAAAWWHYGSVDLTDPDGFGALLFAGARVGPLIREGEVWRVATSLWLHATVLHLLFNVATVVLLGSIVERLYGWRAMVAVYLSSGLIANLALLQNTTPSVGASACVAGLLGLLLGFSARWGRRLPRPLVRLALGNAGLALAACWVISRESASVDHAAHAIGLVVGFAAAFVVAPPMARAWAGRRVGFGVAVADRVGRLGDRPKQGSDE